MTCTEDRDGAIIDVDTTMRDLGDVRRYPASAEMGLRRNHGQLRNT